MKREDLFVAAGGLRATYETLDWSATQIGPPETWSAELAAGVRLVLGTGFPAALMFGPDLRLLYNQPFVQLIGDKHQWALGRPTGEVFGEALHVLGPMLTKVMEGGEAFTAQRSLVPMNRHGFVEDCYITASYSPLTDADGAVIGVIGIATETTAEVLALRRMQLLASLRDTLAAIESATDVPSRALAMLRNHRDDLRAIDIRGNATFVTSAGPYGPILPAAPRSPISGGTDMLIEQRNQATVVWLPLGTTASLKDPAVLVVAVNDRLALDESYQMFLRLLATTLTQCFGRMEVLAAERLAATTERAISESLQLSLLTELRSVPGVEMAARYLPAATLAKIGGDWYDTFHGPDGALHLVMADVAGHDRHAAVLMAQARNILRGIAYSLNLSPARTMEAFDRTLTGLDTQALLSGILARAVIEPDDDRPGDIDGEVAPRLRLTWANAGHPPPIHVSPDGEARLLAQARDALVGVEPERTRREQTVLLRVGSTFVLYTDGLIERRGETIDAGIERLRTALQGAANLTSEQVADRVLERLGQAEDDDIALLVLRVSAGAPKGR